MKLFVYSMREYDELAFLRSSVGIQCGIRVYDTDTVP